MSFSDLERKLLALGGEQVDVRPEPHLDLLLERGRAFPAKGRRRVPGEPHRCHQNVSLYYARHHAAGYGGSCEMVRGYGLSRERFRFQHSWLWDGKRVIETNVSPVLYFGVIFTPLEAANFFFSQVFMALPGWLELASAVAPGRGVA